jgi:hypothetical protein
MEKKNPPHQRPCSTIHFSPLDAVNFILHASSTLSYFSGDASGFWKGIRPGRPPLFLILVTEMCTNYAGWRLSYIPAKLLPKIGIRSEDILIKRRGQTSTNFRHIYNTARGCRSWFQVFAVASSVINKSFPMIQSRNLITYNMLAIDFCRGI